MPIWPDDNKIWGGGRDDVISQEMEGRGGEAAAAGHTHRTWIMSAFLEGEGRGLVVPSSSPKNPALFAMNFSPF
jgi:hypothetical protein